MTPRSVRRPGGDTPAVWSVLQLCDSGFPSGLFTQSGGLETAVDMGLVQDAEDLAAWMLDVLTQSVAPLDGRVLALAWRAAGGGHAEAVRAADRWLEAMRLSREPREASARSGRRVLALAVALGSPGPGRPAGLAAAGVAEALRQWGERGESPCHHACVLGVLGRAWGARLPDLLEGALFATAAGQAAAAVRLGVADHVDGQRALLQVRAHLNDLVRLARARPSSQAPPGASFAPLAEIAAMRHEHAHVRLFAT